MTDSSDNRAKVIPFRYRGKAPEQPSPFPVLKRAEEPRCVRCRDEGSYQVSDGASVQWEPCTCRE